MLVAGGTMLPNSFLVSHLPELENVGLEVFEAWEVKPEGAGLKYLNHKYIITVLYDAVLRSVH